MSFVRLRNLILQMLYRPAPIKILSPKTLASLDAIDKAIEERISPLLSELWR
jgi:hypothetical protein